MTDQIPRPMNKTPPAIRINWSPLPRVTASAPPIVAPIAVAAVRPRTAPGRTLAQGWRVARLIVTIWVLSPISRRATTPRAVAKTRRLSTDGGERPRGYHALDGRFLGRDLANVFQIHERIVEFRDVAQHADGPRSADPHGHIDAQQVLRESPISIWASEPEPLSVNPHLHILDQRLHPRCCLDRSLEGARVLPRERHADVLMENGTQLDPGLESCAVSIGSGEVTTCGISSHDLPQGESVDRHKCDAKLGAPRAPPRGSFSPLKPLRQSLNARVRVNGDSLMARKPIIGVIGGGSTASREGIALAEEVGFLIARADAILLCGGLNGVMEASAKGAKRGGGFTVGILPTGNKADANHHIDLPIATAMSTARNLIIVRTADAIVAVNGSYGTLSEMAHAFDLAKTVFALRTWPMDKAGVEPSLFVPVDTPREAVDRAIASARKAMEGEKPGPGPPK